MKRKRKGNFITLTEVVEDFLNQEVAQKKFDEANNIKIKFIDPIDNSGLDKMYNKTHTDLFMTVKKMSMDELKRLYPLTRDECFFTTPIPTQIP